MWEGGDAGLHNPSSFFFRNEHRAVMMLTIATAVPRLLQLSVSRSAAFFVLEEEGTSGLTGIPMSHHDEVWDVLLAS